MLNYLLFTNKSEFNLLEFYLKHLSSKTDDLNEFYNLVYKSSVAFDYLEHVN